MPRYNATVAMTFKITTEIAVRAKDEEAATERVNQMMAETKFGTLEWNVVDTRIKNLSWNEEEMDVAMDGIEEES